MCSFYDFVPFRYLFVGENIAAVVLDMSVNGTFLRLFIYVLFTIYDNLKVTGLFSIHFEPLVLQNNFWFGMYTKSS